MESQKKLSQLISRVYDYNNAIKNSISNNELLSDDQVLQYFAIKEKCLQTLFDIVSLTKSSKITADTSNALSDILSGISSANELNPYILQEVVNVCDMLEKHIALQNPVYTTKEEKSVFFQSEISSFKKLFGFPDTYVFEKSTCKVLLDDKIYVSMNSMHIQLILDEISCIQKYFFRLHPRKNDIPTWFVRFIYTYDYFVSKKYKQIKEKEEADKIPLDKSENISSTPFFLPPESPKKVAPMPVDFAASYKYLEDFLMCDSYISARDLCQNMIIAFPNHEGTPALREKLKEIQGCIEKLRYAPSSTKSSENIPPAPKKKPAPGSIDPTTGRIRDELFL